MMKVYCMCLGMYQVNCYLLQDEATGEILIVDPGSSPKEIKDRVEALGGIPVGILLTHGHFDHIMGVNQVAEEFNIKIYAYEEEKGLLEDPVLNMSVQTGQEYRVKADVFLTDNEECKISGFFFKVLHTPGHTSGSCCFYFEKENVLISGDTLFYRSCGRTDFATSSYPDMVNSLNRLIKGLPKETAVYPGHDCPTKIGDELRFNPFV